MPLWYSILECHQTEQSPLSKVASREGLVLLIHTKIFFYLRYKIRNVRILEAAVRQHHPDFSADFVPLFVIRLDKLSLFVVNAPLVAEQRCNAQPLLDHLDGNICKGDLIPLVPVALV